MHAFRRTRIHLKHCGPTHLVTSPAYSRGRVRDGVCWDFERASAQPGTAPSLLPSFAARQGKTGSSLKVLCGAFSRDIRRGTRAGDLPGIWGHSVMNARREHRDEALHRLD